MAVLTIRNLDEHVKQQLRQRAAEHRNSMEEEVRCILASAVLGDEAQDTNLAERIHNRFAAAGGVDLPLQDRSDLPKPRCRAANPQHP